MKARVEKTSLQKNTQICMIAIFWGMLFLASCNENSDNGELPDNRIEVKVSATIDEVSDNPINMKWGSNDVIIVNDSKFRYESGTERSADFVGKIGKDTETIVSYYPPYMATDAGIQSLDLYNQQQYGSTEEYLNHYLYMTASYSGDIDKFVLNFQYQVSVLDFEIINKTSADIKVEALLLEGQEESFYQEIFPYSTSNNLKGAKQRLVISNPPITKSKELFSAHLAVCQTSETILDGKTIKITVYTDKGEYSFTRTIEKSFIKGKRYHQALTIE